eukprot:UN03454
MQQQFFAAQFKPMAMPQQQQFVAQPTVFNMMQRPTMKQEFVAEALEFMNRNKRVPKKANHGARPCSSVARNKKNSVAITIQNKHIFVSLYYTLIFLLFLLWLLYTILLTYIIIIIY